MRTNKISFLIIFLLPFFVSCAKVSNGGGTSDPNANSPGDPLPYTGHWLSDCVDLGSGTVDRIYLEIGTDGKVNLAVLVYTGTNCTGTHVLKDNSGNDVTAAVYTQNISAETVTDLPDNLFVAKITDINTSVVQYVVLYVNDAEFFELTGFTTPHDTWTQWQGESDVFGFNANPMTYTPTDPTHIKYHFLKAELP
jgi:hypothetical protein